MSTSDAALSPVGPSDAQLVDRIGARDPTALTELYRRYEHLVRGSALRICGPDEAEDVTQDVFLRLWRRPDAYDARRGSLRTYLHMQARSHAIGVIRRDRSRDRRERVVGRDGHPPHLDVADTVIGQVRVEAVRRRLACLPSPQRQAIVLAFFGQFSYREVARLLDVPEGTVKSRIRAGLTALRHNGAGSSANASASAAPAPPAAPAPADGQAVMAARVS